MTSQVRVSAAHDMSGSRLLYSCCIPAADDSSGSSLILLFRILLSDDNGVSWLLAGSWCITTAHGELTIAGDQWIAPEAFGTGADGPVIPHFAVGIQSTSLNTRVAAVVVEAGSVVRTLAVVLAVTAST